MVEHFIEVKNGEIRTISTDITVRYILLWNTPK